MTDKEVIIDGVNVAGCEFYDKSSKWSCKMYIDQYGDADCACDEYGMNNCYYKQLQRKEQELNEIKKYLGISNKTIMQRLEELQEFRDKDKMDLFDYKQALEEILDYIKTFSKCDTWCVVESKAMIPQLTLLQAEEFITKIIKEVLK